MKVQIIRAAKNSCLFITCKRKLIRLYCPFIVVHKVDGKTLTVLEIVFENSNILYQTNKGVIKHSNCEIQNI